MFDDEKRPSFKEIHKFLTKHFVNLKNDFYFSNIKNKTALIGDKQIQKMKSKSIFNSIQLIILVVIILSVFSISLFFFSVYTNKTLAITKMSNLFIKLKFFN